MSLVEQFKKLKREGASDSFNDRLLAIKGEKGEPGEPGKTPRKGVDYFTAKEINELTAELSRRVRVLVKDGQPGREGKAGKPGRDGKDGHTPVAGVDYPSRNQIREYIASIEIKDGKDGRTPVKGVDYFTDSDIRFIAGILVRDFIKKDTPEQTRDKLSSLKGDARLDASAIKNIDRYIPKSTPQSRGKTIRRGGGATVQYYDLSGSTDGSTKDFTIPVHSRVLMVWGTDFPVVFRPLTDYTVSGTTLTLTSEVPAPSAGATLIVLYVE